MRYINEILENERVIGHFLCKRKELRESRAGKSFLSLKLADKTGILDGKVWEITNDIGQCEEGEMIKVDGTTTLYNGELQLKITKMRRSLPSEYNIEDYVAVSKREIGEMFGKIENMIKGVKNKFVRTLLENIFIEHEKISALFKSHSAAMHMHHSFMGGLLEHTLSVAEISLMLGARYKHVNMDLLLAGALLHDIGKIYELTAMPMVEYTDDGQMLGHIIIGVELVTCEAAKIENFPHDLASLIKHLIISHHGEYEFGSPKLPSTPEAMILHYADNVDAKLTMFDDILDTTPGQWSGFNKSIGRYLRKTV